MRILAINDVSCIGKCSLTVSLPILSACGITCDVLPTAILSTHTGGFEGYTFRDLTGDIPNILNHWRSLNIRFDAVYSGYLGSIEQIALVSQIKREFLKPDGLFFVDPVMGDDGKLYAGFTDEFISRMRGLCAEADYILPNVTEACYLADAPYPNAKERYPVERIMEKLTTLCKRPIVTGIAKDEQIIVAYTDENGKLCQYATECIDGFFHGSGDVFTSAFVGALMKGKDEKTAIRIAADFTTAAIRRTAVNVPDKRYGLDFEEEIFSFLKNLNA